MTSSKPRLIIVDGSVAVTGALVSAARQAALLADRVETVLALPKGHRVPSSHLTPFAAVIELQIVPLRKTAGSLLAYGPALLRSSFCLRRELDRLGSERVQINDFYLLQGSLLRLLGFKGRIVTFVRIDPTRFGIAGRIWLTVARRSSNEIVAVSRFIQRLLGDRVPSRLVYEHVVPGEVPLEHPSTSLFLFVGNIIEGKGQDLAAEAFNRIAMHYPEARLRFVGGDMGLAKNRAFRERVERIAAEGPARNRIEFSGPVDDLDPEYREAFASLNFSASESFSMTCLDACAAGLPLVATRCGGPEEIIEDGKTGWLVPVGDVSAMAERMAWLLEHRAEARTMGEAGHSLVADRFSPQRAIAGLFDALGLANGGALR